MTLYRLLFRKEAILPLEMDVPTWSTLPWEAVQTREDLIALRAQQLFQRDEDIAEAIHHLTRMRDANQSYHDGRKQLRIVPLEIGSQALLHDSQRQEDLTWTQCFRYRWSDPYRIRNIVHGVHSRCTGRFILNRPVQKDPRDSAGIGRGKIAQFPRQGADRILIATQKSMT